MKELSQLLQAFQTGQLTATQTEEQITEMFMQASIANLEYASLDLDRVRRTGFPEAIYGESKTVEQLFHIIEQLMIKGLPVLATGISSEKADYLIQRIEGIIYHKTARLLTFGKLDRLVGGQQESSPPVVAVVCAGTSDLPVAEQCAITLEFAGLTAERIYDVGVAGLHRLLRRLPDISQANVVIVIAGMEGALPSVLASLIRQPVIAVPTSIGYGANLQGITPLLAMLSSCSPGITVTNIDNGFGAACAAIRICQTP